MVSTLYVMQAILKEDKRAERQCFLVIGRGERNTLLTCLGSIFLTYLNFLMLSFLFTLHLVWLCNLEE